MITLADRINTVQLTFRSLSLSLNISLSTSLVSATVTVCMVAVEQRLWRKDRIQNTNITIITNTCYSC